MLGIVSARDGNKDRGVSLSGYQWYSDAVEMARVPGIDVYVELIGGSEGVAKDACAEQNVMQMRHNVIGVVNNDVHGRGCHYEPR